VLFRSRFALAVQLGLPLLVVAGLFLLPLALIVRMSLSHFTPAGTVPAITLENYAYLLGDAFYRQAMWRTVEVALLVSFACLLLGYPLALILTRARSRLIVVVTFILITPLFVSVVIRTFGWLILLERQGLVNGWLLRWGVLADPLRLLNNTFGVSLSLVNVGLAFMVFPLVAALAAIPRSLHEAAQTLGAGPFRAWWHITWPLSTPGVLAGFTLVLTLTLSAFVQPRVLGGAAFSVVPVQIWRQIGVLNWPLAGALGVTLLAISAGLAYLVYVVSCRMFRTDEAR
jgi:putative spermidine/putrescine transport system permease protein